jgi:hypothetical protein
MLQALGLPALLRLVGMGGARAAAAAAAPATATAVRAAAPALGSAAQAVAPAASSGVSKLNVALGGLGTLGALSGIPYLFGMGQPSEEDQERMLRRQLEIQAEFEQGNRGGGGETMDPRLAGLVQGEPRGMTGLLMDEDFTRQMADVSKEMGKLQRTRPRGSSELEGIIAGNEAAIAQIQNERVLSPMEIIQMLESMNG